MRSINTLQKKYPDIQEYEFGNIRKIKIKNRYIAKRLSSDTDWRLTKAQIIPDVLIGSVKKYSIGATRRGIATAMNSKVRFASILSNVILCRVTGVINNASFFDEDNHPGKVLFEDVLILKPLQYIPSSVTIYVMQSEAGHFQPQDVASMVGQTVPVLINTLYKTQVGEAYDELRNYDFDEKGTEVLKDEYIAIASIDDAEYITGREVLNHLETPVKNDPIFDVQEGIVSYITKNGVFLLSSKKERIFIKTRDFSYKRLSPIYRQQNGGLRDVVQIGDIVKYKIQAAKDLPNTDENKARGIMGRSVVILGERLSLEHKPTDAVFSILQSGEGTVVSGHIVKWDVLKGHEFEPEGCYGYTFRLTHNDQITREKFLAREELSVRIGGPKVTQYKWMQSLDGKGDKYLRLNVKVTLNNYYDHKIDDLISDFFD